MYLLESLLLLYELLSGLTGAEAQGEREKEEGSSHNLWSQVTQNDKLLIVVCYALDVFHDKMSCTKGQMENKCPLNVLSISFAKQKEPPPPLDYKLQA